MSLIWQEVDEGTVQPLELVLLNLAGRYADEQQPRRRSEYPSLLDVDDEEEYVTYPTLLGTRFGMEGVPDEVQGNTVIRGEYVVQQEDPPGSFINSVFQWQDRPIAEDEDLPDPEPEPLERVVLVQLKRELGMDSSS